ncbi:hypothetical protein B7P43_G09143 [Cryptotermes secundus]|uniref:C2H2-type domain-containing protein n=1 Tax=Cryptotermes secundus TaxID=105785 RepID=A0A2J7Q3G2_9NEOP|nr:hypothetical protein B7P43_G09143 [Cryptotermes secundus]
MKNQSWEKTIMTNNNPLPGPSGFQALVIVEEDEMAGDSPLSLSVFFVFQLSLNQQATHHSFKQAHLLDISSGPLLELKLVSDYVKSVGFEVFTGYYEECHVVKPKEEGSVEDTRMIGNKFCDVTVIAPHYVGNHASEQALAEKDLLRKPMYKEKYNAADMRPDVQVPLTSATQNFPVEETPVISIGDTGMCQHIYQWGQISTGSQSSDSSQYNYGETHTALSYWDKQFGQSGNHTLAAAALQQWIMSTSDNSNGNTPESPALKKPVDRCFDCSYCSKSFLTQKAIDNHVRIHTGEKPYLCHVCGMNFSQEGNLSMHVKVHTGEKPFQCLVCSKFFATRTHLEKHTRTHTGEKPYTCATCHKSFSDRGYFMRHLAVHTGEKSHICNVCSKAFTQRISLKRHSRIHTGEKPFECVICREAFSLKRDLKRHGEKMHNIDKAIIQIKHQFAHIQHFTNDLNERSIDHSQY